MPSELIESDLTGSVISSFYEVYNALGFGFLENIYLNSLEKELVKRGHKVARQYGVLVQYKGEIVGKQRLDMVIDSKLVVEIKSTTDLHPHARRQLRNYLRATDLELGLLLHFGPEPKFYRILFQKHFKQLPSKSV